MGTVENVSGIREWVETLLYVAPMEERSWKYFSGKYDWKVKTHGFSTCEVSAASIPKMSLAHAQEIITSASSSKRKVDESRSVEVEDDEESALMHRSRRRRVISEDESTPATMPSVPKIRPSTSGDVSSFPTHDSVDHLFCEGFGSVIDEVPLAVFYAPFRESALTISSAPLAITAPIAALPMTSSATQAYVPNTSSAPQISLPVASLSQPVSMPPVREVGFSSRGMKQVLIEVPADGSLFKKSGQPKVWLKPLIDPTERTKLDSHSALTCANEVVHSSLKTNLIGIELMERISNTEQELKENHAEVGNWKGKYESPRIDMDALEEERSTLKRQMRLMVTELAVEKASSNQADKDKSILESSFAEQLSRVSEEIKSLKDLLGQKEEYSGELVQSLTRTQEDLRIALNKIQSLEESIMPLRDAHEAAETEKDGLKAELQVWARDYEDLEEAAVVNVCWAYMTSRFDFDLDAEIAKTKEALEKAQQGQNISSPECETPAARTSSSQVAPLPPADEEVNLPPQDD